MNEYYGAPTTQMDDYLAHYGIKGMKWGVRKAVALGNQKMLDAHFRKAAKKLYKLQDKALHSGKYAAKAAGYGAAAAGAGTLAIGGTGLAAKGIKSAGKAMEGAGRGMLDAHQHKHLGTALMKIGRGTSKAGAAFEEWGLAKDKPKYTKVRKRIKDRSTGKWKDVFIYKNAQGVAPSQAKTMSNDTKFRIGAGIASAGLAGLAARNAYIAANGRKYMDKADNFRRSMDEAFAGTKYSGQYVAPPKQKKRRKNNG